MPNGQAALTADPRTIMAIPTRTSTMAITTTGIPTVPSISGEVLRVPMSRG